MNDFHYINGSIKQTPESRVALISIIVADNFYTSITDSALNYKYQMMYNKDLVEIPVASLISPGSLVAVWCTNCESHVNALKTSVFPAWGLSYLGKWFWIKVTRSGKPVCSFSDPPGKQPFEQIIFGWKETKDRVLPLPPDGMVVVSVPSAIHSHKPPLSELLSTFLPENPQCLELFARYLLPGWTSWGLEVLKLQDIMLYEQKTEEGS
uniref:Uncharacterized protein n=1 Tax=Timema bartmani TaxID=61472 RepID=A0A7R9I6K5_9NEOP|nr:unnamed protein product [Timema bartmani]